MRFIQEGISSQINYLSNLINGFQFISSGKLYWTDWNRVKPTIESANLDGTMRTTLVEKDLKLPNHIVIDYEHNDLCWTDAGLHRIECINLYNTASRRVIYAQASMC